MTEATWSGGGRSGGRALLQRLQRQPDGGVKLGIAPRGPVVRRDCHLDVRIHAVVLQRYYVDRYGLRPKEQFFNAYAADLLTLALPLYPQLTEDEQVTVVEALRAGLH